MRDHWDEAYLRRGERWGRGPSEIALIAEERLATLGRRGPLVRVLDLGCGYGRDAFYLHDRLGVAVLGVDASAEAVALAEGRFATLAGGRAPVTGLRFRQARLEDLDAGLFDAVLVSGLYHLLDSDGRRALAAAVERHLAPGGRLFLSTLSTNDPEHYGRGVTAPGELDSFIDAVYLHFARERELRETFAFLRVQELYEHEHLESQSDGSVHHHVVWILVAARRGQPRDGA